MEKVRQRTRGEEGKKIFFREKEIEKGKRRGKERETQFNIDGSSINFTLVEDLEGLISFCVCGHLHKPITTRAGASHDDVGRKNFASISKFFLKFFFSNLERKVSNENLRFVISTGRSKVEKGRKKERGKKEGKRR